MVGMSLVDLKVFMLFLDATTYLLVSVLFYPSFILIFYLI